VLLNKKDSTRETAALREFNSPHIGLGQSRHGERVISISALSVGEEHDPKLATNEVEGSIRLYEQHDVLQDVLEEAKRSLPADAKLPPIPPRAQRRAAVGSLFALRRRINRNGISKKVVRRPNCRSGEASR
jgi:hypothetical protein